jgi:hypothetical protein
MTTWTILHERSMFQPCNIITYRTLVKEIPQQIFLVYILLYITVHVVLKVIIFVIMYLKNIENNYKTLIPAMLLHINNIWWQ